MNFRALWIGKRSIFGLGVAAVFFVLVYLEFVAAKPAYAIPAFARKYNLPCSACHEAWPKLNNFGQVFRDNGYQLGSGKDSPIWQNPSYWPITFRITPQWHRESSSNQKVDSIPGDATSPPTEKTLTSHGFDLSGVDIWTAGTLYKNISFSVLPSSDSSGSFHFENAWVRFDDLLGSRWANLKFGKFELDNMISEKRMPFPSCERSRFRERRGQSPKHWLRPRRQSAAHRTRRAFLEQLYALLADSFE